MAAVHLQAVGTCPLAALMGSLSESFGGRAAGPCLRPAVHQGVLVVQEQGWGWPGGETAAPAQPEFGVSALGVRQTH